MMALASQRITLDYISKIPMIAVCAYAWFQEEQYLDLFYVLGNKNPHEQLLTVWGCSAEKMERWLSVHMPAGDRQFHLSSIQRQVQLYNEISQSKGIFHVLTTLFMLI